MAPLGLFQEISQLLPRAFGMPVVFGEDCRTGLDGEYVVLGADLEGRLWITDDGARTWARIDADIAPIEIEWPAASTLPMRYAR